MIRRHPHVFGPKADTSALGGISVAEVRSNWEKQDFLDAVQRSKRYITGGDKRKKARALANGEDPDGDAATLGSSDTRSSLYGMAAGLDHWLSAETVAGIALAGGGLKTGQAIGETDELGKLPQAANVTKQPVASALEAALLIDHLLVQDLGVIQGLHHSPGGGGIGGIGIQ